MDSADEKLQAEVSLDFLEIKGTDYCEFEKGKYIIRQGETVEYLYYLVSGICHRMLISEKGDEIVYGIKESNNYLNSLLGVLVLFRSGISGYNFVAKTKCRCIKIPRKGYWKYLQDRPETLYGLLHSAMLEYHELGDIFQARQEGKVANRLCEFLLKNFEDSQGRLLVNKRFSNVELGRLLGIHEVTVARILRELKNKRIIKREQDGIIILDEIELANYAYAKKNLEY